MQNYVSKKIEEHEQCNGDLKRRPLIIDKKSDGRGQTNTIHKVPMSLFSFSRYAFLITAILSFCSFSFSLYYGFRESRLSPIHSKVAIFLHASYHPCTLFGIILFALSLSFWFVRFAFFHFSSLVTTHSQCGPEQLYKVKTTPNIHDVTTQRKND